MRTDRSALDQPSLPQANILLVDDRPGDLLALETLLLGLNYNLAQSASGEEALRRLLDEDFAVVLLNVHMPGLNGFEVVKRMRAQNRCLDTSVIFISAYQSDEFPVVEAYRLGAVDYLVKPLVPEIVRAKVAVFADLFRKNRELALLGATRAEQADCERCRLLETERVERRRETAERRSAEETLREREGYFRLLAENIDDVFWVMDAAAHRLLYVSQAYEKIWGRSCQSLYAEPFSFVDAVHPEDRPRLATAIEAQLRGEQLGYAGEVEYRVVRPDGSVRWVCDRAWSVPEGDGPPRWLMGTARDVTECHEFQERLRESEERFRQLAENIDEAFWLMDMEPPRVLYCNPAAAAVFGRPLEELRADPSSGFAGIHPGDRGWVEEAYRGMLAGRGFTEWGLAKEYRVVGPDGSVRWVSGRVFPVRVSAGRVHRVAGITRDVTDRKRMEESLRKAQEFLTRLLDHAPAPIYVMAPDGHCHLVNRACEELWRLSCEEAVGRTLEELLPARLARRFQEQDRQVLETAEPLISEDVIEAPNGVHYFHTVKFPLRDTAGQVEAVAGVSVDITERRQAEERLRSLSRRLVEVQEEERRHLARELHDEIGQLLTGLQFILERNMELPPAAAGPKLGEALAILENLLARVRQLSSDLRPALLDTLGLLPALGELFAHYTRRTGVRVHFEQAGLEERLTPEVETTAYRIIQEALTNVARHACVGAAEVRLWADGGMLDVQVADRGVGFDPEAARASEGTVGLTGMLERAMLQGGELLVESVPGGGTQVTARLPLSGPSGDTAHEDFDRAGG